MTDQSIESNQKLSPRHLTSSPSRTISLNSMAPKAAQSQPEAPSEHRKHPCVLCQQRKVKCDRNEPCRNCTKAGLECISAATLPPRKRKRRFPEAELLARIRRYELHLRNYGADIDAINQENFDAESTSMITLPTSAQRLGSIKSSESGSPVTVNLSTAEDTAERSLSVRRSLRHVENNLDLDLSEEFRDAAELFEDTSEDETYPSPNYPLNVKPIKQRDGVPEGEEMLLGLQPGETIQNLHPSPVQIFRLWQAFLDKVNPLIKIFHAPSVQQKVLEATSDLGKIPKNTEALLFGIYATAGMAMDDETIKTVFGEERGVVLTRFQRGTRQALANAGYLRSSDIVVLQAFTLFLLSCTQMTMDPRALFCITGVAVRIAQRMGLSTDGTNYAIPPFEVEMRRRLWWQILFIDMRASERSGAGAAVLQYTWSTKLPSNVNDSDLFPAMRDPPAESPGITEMVFVRLRCEVTLWLQESRKFESSSANEEAVAEFTRYLERDYLDYCDPLVPLHMMSTAMIRSTVCKLRLGGTRFPHFLMNPRNEFSTEHKEKVFQASLEMLEIHIASMNNPALRGYFWHVYSYFPFPAHLYLICALRHRANDEFADKAWELLSQSAETRERHGDMAPTPSSFRQPHTRKETYIDMALGNIAVKAWEARQSSSSQEIPVPRFISKYRKWFAEKQTEGETPPVFRTPPMEQTGQTFDSQFGSQYSMLGTESFNMNANFGQTMMPGVFPTDMASSGWGFWNNMMQADDPMQGTDTVPPPYNYYQG